MFDQKNMPIKIVASLIGLALILHVSSGNEDRGPKFLIDTDAGADDAVAILLALGAQMNIVAITCTYGNTVEANVEKNVLKILKVANREDVPVFSGSLGPFINNYTDEEYFGKDGLGDFEFEETLNGRIDRGKHAAIAMVDLAKRHRGELNIITLGPLTNVALALGLDPKFSQNVKQFYVMGSTENTTEPEFNFKLDPESNRKFLTTKMDRLPIIIPFSTVEAGVISKEWRTETLGSSSSKAVQFLNKAENISMSRSKNWLSADTLAVATALWPEMILHKPFALIDAIVCDTNQGSTIEGGEDDAKNVIIIRDFNVTFFQEKLLQYLS